jgi:membrane protein
VSIVGLVGDPASTTQTVTQIVTKLGPTSAADTFAGPIKSITSHRSAAGVLLVVGLATALWSASSYVGAFMRAANVIYETPEGRPFWKLRPLQILMTLVMLLLLAAVALALVLTGSVVDAVAGPLGVGSTAVSIWNVAKWPVLLGVVVTMFAVLFYAAPNVKLAGFRWVTRARSSRSACGSSRRRPSRSTSPTSARTTRPTARWEAWSASWSGSGSPTSRCCSAWSSTPSASAVAS